MNGSQHIPRWIDESAILDPFDHSDPLMGQPVFSHIKGFEQNFISISM